MATSICSVLDNRGCRVAQIDLESVENEWYYGRLLSDAFSDELRHDLGWYDEVVSDQMLSYVDDALRASNDTSFPCAFPMRRATKSTRCVLTSQVKQSFASHRCHRRSRAASMIPRPGLNDRCRQLGRIEQLHPAGDHDCASRSRRRARQGVDGPRNRAIRYNLDKVIRTWSDVICPSHLLPSSSER